MTPNDLLARRTRLGAAMSRAALAKLFGVDAVTIWRWEQGKREIPDHVDLALRWIEEHPEARQ